MPCHVSPFSLHYVFEFGVQVPPDDICSTNDNVQTLHISLYGMFYDNAILQFIKPNVKKMKLEYFKMLSFGSVRPLHFSTFGVWNMCMWQCLSDCSDNRHLWIVQVHIRLSTQNLSQQQQQQLSIVQWRGCWSEEENKTETWTLLQYYHHQHQKDKNGNFHWIVKLIICECVGRNWIARMEWKTAVKSVKHRLKQNRTEEICKCIAPFSFLLIFFSVFLI